MTTLAATWRWSGFEHEQRRPGQTYLGADLLSDVSPKAATGNNIKYNITFSVTPTASVYTLQAAPANGQVSDSCGTLTLTNTGVQTPSTSGCW